MELITEVVAPLVNIDFRKHLTVSPLQDCKIRYNHRRGHLSGAGRAAAGAGANTGTGVPTMVELL